MQEWTDTPGQSLFQDSIHINSQALRQEEDEDQEDQKRRNIEIKHLMDNAFGDFELDDDDDDDDDDDEDEDEDEDDDGDEDDDDDDDDDASSIASNRIQIQNVTDINRNNNSIIHTYSPINLNRNYSGVSHCENNIADDKYNYTKENDSILSKYHNDIGTDNRTKLSLYANDYINNYSFATQASLSPIAITTTTTPTTTAVAAATIKTSPTPNGTNYNKNSPYNISSSGDKSDNDESDSIKQMKLGVNLVNSKLNVNSNSNNNENNLNTDSNIILDTNVDISSTWREELTNCFQHLDVKQKIVELENVIREKEIELERSYETINSITNEAKKYSQCVNQLKYEQEIFINQHSIKTDAQIQRLKDHLSKITAENESLLNEKNQLEETIKKFHEETLNGEQQQQQQQHINNNNNNNNNNNKNYVNEAYLDIHQIAFDKVNQNAKIEMIDLVVQLDQKQKELTDVKQLFVNLCGTKDKLINDHKLEIEKLKKSYANSEKYKDELDKLKISLNQYMKNSEKLNNECEQQRKKILQLETTLELERNQRSEYMKKIHDEIERAKEDALNEIRQTHPERQISILLPNDQSSKILELENECKKLKEKLALADVEQKKMTDLSDAELKIAQFEIKYDTLLKIYKNSQTDNKTLKNKCENLTKNNDEYKSKILNLEKDLSDCNKKLIECENIIQNDKNKTKNINNNEELNKELSKYKEMVQQLTRKDEKTSANELFNEERIKQLELELNNKNIHIKRLEEIKNEKDELVNKLKSQAKKLSGELNLSPRSTLDDIDFQQVYQITIKKIREEMEQKVAEELKLIEDKNRIKENDIKDKYKNIISELKSRYTEKTQELNELKEAMLKQRKLQASFNTQEQIVGQIMQELFAKKLKIEELQQQIQQKEINLEEEKNAMAGLMSDWAKEMEIMKQREIKMLEEINRLHSIEKKMTEDINHLQKKEKQLKSHIEDLKHKYNSAKNTAQNYKERGEKKEKFLMGECKRIEEGYKKAMNQVQQNVEEIVNTQRKVEVKVKELESQYERKLKQIKYKS